MVTGKRGTTKQYIRNGAKNSPSDRSFEAADCQSDL